MSHQPKFSSKNKNQKDNNILNIDQMNDNNKNYTSQTLYTFGSNEMGQLGYIYENSYIHSFTPMVINTLSNKIIISMSAGDGHSVCSTEDGLVYSWGASACGQLGLDEDDKMPRDSEGYPYQPIPLNVKLLSEVKINEVSCGDAHTLALSYDGKIYSWGGAGCGQLGHPNINSMLRDADNCPYLPYPRLIESLKNSAMSSINCGKAHSISIDVDGLLYTWGAGACGQLGVEDDDGYPYLPVPKYVKALKDQIVTSGVCGDVHTIVMTKKGDLYSFGGCTFGQLGLGSIDRMPVDLDKYPYMPIPHKIDGIPEIVYITCGDSHSMAIDILGKLWAWGSAVNGQLGIDTHNLPKDMDGICYQPNPTQVNYFKNQKIVSVACGESHTLVLAEGDILYSFGTGTCGQLGYLDVNSKSTLKIQKSENFIQLKPRVINSLIGKNISKISCGGVHNLILTHNEIGLGRLLYKLLNSQTYTDIEIITDKSKIRCHSLILISRSEYFYQRIIVNKERGPFNFPNHDIITVIINYLYLDDISFLKEKKRLNQLVELYKITKLFNLRTLLNEIENKMKLHLSKYNQVFQHFSLFDSDVDDDNNSDNDNFKGLFFLPNGNGLLLLDESIINNVIDNSIVLNLNNTTSIENKFNNSKSITQKHKLSNKNRKIIKESTTSENDDIEKKSILIKLTITQSICSEIFDGFKTDDKFNFFEFFKKKLNTENEIDNISIANNLSLEYDLLKIFNNIETYDIILNVDGYKFYSHKLILITRSKFFEMMLSENMLERINGEVSISNCTVEEFILFLLFLYIDIVPIDIDIGLDLMKCLDMFIVDDLKTKLEKFLSTNLTIDNCSRIYKSASTYNYDKLKKICLAFIKENYENVVETKDFEELPSEFLVEVIRYCK